MPLRRHVLFPALLTLPLVTHAWGADGHQTVATIAARLIQGTPTEARVTELLGDISLPLASLWADCAKGVSPAQQYRYPSPGKYPECAPLETPARMAEMADYVRRNDRQCQIGPDEDSCHRQAHYTDVAVQRSRYALGFIGTRTDDVAGALRTAVRVLQGKPAAGPPQFKSKREALLVLVHLVADIHQPLHVAALYLDAQGQRVDPDKAGLDPASFTVGGNSLWVVAAPQATRAARSPSAPVTTGAAPLKLHTLWDSVPDALKPQRVDAAWLAEARQLPTDADDPADWAERWATQSLEQARLAFDGLVISPRQGAHWNVVLPPGYSARADAIKREQLTRAGAGLAQLLRAVLN